MSEKSGLFGLGTVVATQAVNTTMKGNMQFRMDVYAAVERYRTGDWGNTGEDGKQKNDNAVKYGNDRVFAEYDTSKGKIWIITESDRSSTTVLFPSDY